MSKLRNYIDKNANKVIRHTDWYNNQLWGGATKFWNFSQFGLDVVNLGSGAAVYDFNYDGLDIKGANWALAPQSLVHDFNILKNFFSYIKEGGCVLITVCPFSGLFSMYDNNHNFKYYTFLHPATIQNFDEKERQRALLIKQNPIKAIPDYCIKSTIKEYYIKVKNNIYSKLKNKRYIDVERTANQIMEGWMKQFQIDDLSRIPSSQHKGEIISRRQTLIEMVSFCKERSLRPFIVLPVMHESLSSLFPADFIRYYIDSLLYNVDAPLLNYMNDDFCKNSDLFTTALFLNKKGAKLFTRKVIQDIAKLNF